MTFVGDNLKDGGTAGHTRLRKNPGFQLLSENMDFVSKINVKYSFEIIKIKSSIECKINGTTVHKVMDAEPYNKGSIGFRTWNTRLWYDNLKVYSISEKD
jgi:hypothetical protein